MKKMTKIVALFLSGVMLFTSTTFFTAAAKETPSCKNLVVLGDSLSTGYGLEGYREGDNTSAKDSYANTLAKKYGLVAGKTYTNLAEDGLTTLGLRNILTNESTAPIFEAALKNADTVVLSSSCSDFLRALLQLLNETVLQNKAEFEKAGFKIDSSTKEALLKSLGVAMKADTKKLIASKLAGAAADAKDSFIDVATNAMKNLKAIVGEIRKSAPNCKIYVLTLYGPLGSIIPGFTGTFTSLFSAGIKTSLQALAPATEVVDIAPLFNGKDSELTNISAANIYPNKDGHKVIYDAIISAMESSATSEPVETTVPEITSDGVSCKNLVLLGDAALTGCELDGDLTKDCTCGNMLAKRYGLVAGKTYTDLTADRLTTDKLLASFTDKSTAPIVKKALANADTVVISAGINDYIKPVLELLAKTVEEHKEALEKAGFKIDSSTPRTLFESIGTILKADTEKIIRGKLEEAAKLMLDNFTAITTNAVKNINTVVGEVRKNAPNCKIYVLTMFAPLSTTDGYELTPATGLNKGIKESLKGLAPATEVVDIEPLFDGRGNELTNILIDDIHPNKDGHKVIYDALTAAIDKNATEEPVETTVPEITDDDVSCDNLVLLGDEAITWRGLDGDIPKDSTCGNMLSKRYGLVSGKTYTDLTVDGLTSLGLSASFTDKNKAPIVKEALKNADTVIISAGGNDFASPLMELLGVIVKENKDELEKLGFKIDSSSEKAFFISIGEALKADTKGIILGLLKQSNNILADTFSDIIADAVENINTTVSEVRKIAPDCKIYVLTMYFPMSATKSYELSYVSDLNNSIIESLQALAPATEVVDIAPLFDGKGPELTNFLKGDSHLNKDGHKAVYDALTAVIDKNDTEEPVEPTVPEITDDGVSCSNLVVLGDAALTGCGLDGDLPQESTCLNMLIKKYGLEAGKTYTDLTVDGLTSLGLRVSFTDKSTAPIVKDALKNADTVIISAGSNDFMGPILRQLGKTVEQNKAELEKAGFKIDSSSERALYKSIGAALKVDTTGIIMDKLKESAELSFDDFSAIAKTAIININAIVSEVRKNAPNSKIYVLTMYSPMSNAKGYELTPAIEFNKGIKESLQALAPATEVVDLSPMFDGKGTELTNILNGDLHLNKDGHKVIYDLLTAAIDKNGTGEPVETTAPEVTSEEPVNGDTDTNTPDKTSPEAGIEGVGVVIGVGLLGLLGVVIAKKRK